MHTPDPAELRKVAQYNVGDEVWTRSSGPWLVVGRWWLTREQCIAYDLQFRYNGVLLPKVVEHEVFAERQHAGYRGG